MYALPKLRHIQGKLWDDGMEPPKEMRNFEHCVLAELDMGIFG